MAGAIEWLTPADAGAPNPIEAMSRGPGGLARRTRWPRPWRASPTGPYRTRWIWRDDPAAQLAGGAVLSVGEVALFASAGGLGKSAVTLALALAAADAAVRGEASGAACGLRVRAGPVLFANYEDSPVRMAHRLRWLAGATAIPEAVRALPDPGPLYEADPDHGGPAKPSPAWSQLALAAKLIRPALIVADPASAALAGAGNDSGAVRAFMRALAQLADASGAGVLIVAHDTKGARNEARAGGDPGAGAVAGICDLVRRGPRSAVHAPGSQQPRFPADRVLEGEPRAGAMGRAAWRAVRGRRIRRAGIARPPRSGRDGGRDQAGGGREGEREGAPCETGHRHGICAG